MDLKYTKWNNKFLNSIQSHEFLLKILDKLSMEIFRKQSNHEIMKVIAKKDNKSLEENVIRWWDETLSYPNWTKNTYCLRTELLFLHIIPVLKQRIPLWNFLEISRELNKYGMNE
jgi:hypothetical protein